MVRPEEKTHMSVDYQGIYNAYWQGEARESSGPLADVAEQIVMACGLDRTLDVGAGQGALVQALLRRGVDAFGIDVSNVVVTECEARIPGRFSCGSVLQLPYADEEFQTVVSTYCLDHLAPDDVPVALRELHRVTARYAVLKLNATRDPGSHWHLTSEGRGWWERICFESGFRKHPAYYRINAYESLNEDEGSIVIPLEKIPHGALLAYPLISLREERDLHMDMLREHGSRSDAHVGRYEFASRYVRPGDVVLDAACGLGYGSHLIHSLTRCSSITGVDGSVYGIDYAARNFARRAGIRFEVGYLPDCLARWADSSVDCIISFETLEHVENPETVLAEFHRILSPGGRLIASVPHDWSDHTGEDPNPYHLHVYTYPKFVGQLRQLFDIEGLVGQTADRVKKPKSCEWMVRPRLMQNLSTDDDASDIEAEWLLSVACKSPHDGLMVPYTEKVFTAEEQVASGNALAFGRDYKNPWLIRSLISIGLRTENALLRRRWAQETLNSYPVDSADYGAALCLLAYHELGSPSTVASSLRFDLAALIDSYVRLQPPLNPNVLRWQVSLHHVQGLRALARGDHIEAQQHLSRVIDCPVASYSPTLLTKPAEAAYLLGLVQAGQGRISEARQTWLTSFRRVLADAGTRLSTPYDEVPPGFELREVANAVIVAGRSAVAANNVDALATQPLTFFNEVNGDVIARMDGLALQSEAHQQGATFHAAQAARLADQLQELYAGKVWLESQRDAWEAVATSRAQSIETLEASVVQAHVAAETRLADLLEGKAWLEAQREAWEKVAAERADSISELQARATAMQAQVERLSKEFESMQAAANTQHVSALEAEVQQRQEVAARLADTEAQLHKIRSYWAVRLVKYLSNKTGWRIGTLPRR